MQSALADMINHFLAEKAGRLSVFVQPRSHIKLPRKGKVYEVLNRRPLKQDPVTLVILSLKFVTAQHVSINSLRE